MIPFSDLVSRVIQQESGGNPSAVNASSGASGLMQIMPATAASPGFGIAPLPWDQRFDATANKRFGEDYLGAMLDRYDGDQARALAAYNWGPGNADKWSGDMAALPEETRNYITSIMGMGSVPSQTYAPSSGGAPAQDQPPATPAAETMKLFGFDTGKTPEQFQGLAEAFTPKQQPVSAPPIQRGQGYVKREDSLTRALTAFQQTRQNRRA